MIETIELIRIRVLLKIRVPQRWRRPMKTWFHYVKEKIGMMNHKIMLRRLEKNLRIMVVK